MIVHRYHRYTVYRITAVTISDVVSREIMQYILFDSLSAVLCAYEFVVWHVAAFVHIVMALKNDKIKIKKRNNNQ